MAGEDRVYVPGYPGQGESLAPAFKQSGGGGAPGAQYNLSYNFEAADSLDTWTRYDVDSYDNSRRLYYGNSWVWLRDPGQWGVYSCDSIETDVEDFFISGEVQAASTNGLQAWGVRSDLKDDGSQTEYRLLWHKDYMRIEKVLAGVPTSLGQVSVGTGLNDNWGFRFEVFGTTMRARTWNVPGTEPGTWQIDKTDSDIKSGKLGFFAYLSSRLDNLSIVAQSSSFT